MRAIDYLKGGKSKQMVERLRVKEMLKINSKVKERFHLTFLNKSPFKDKSRIKVTAVH